MICLPKPNRHHDCIRYAVQVLGLTPPIGAGADQQGFYTAEGKYLRRAAALNHAQKHNQLINPDARRYLFSEDVW